MKRLSGQERDASNLSKGSISSRKLDISSRIPEDSLAIDQSEHSLHRRYMDSFRNKVVHAQSRIPVKQHSVTKAEIKIKQQISQIDVREMLKSIREKRERLVVVHHSKSSLKAWKGHRFSIYNSNKSKSIDCGKLKPKKQEQMVQGISEIAGLQIHKQAIVKKSFGMANMESRNSF